MTNLCEFDRTLAFASRADVFQHAAVFVAAKLVSTRAGSGIQARYWVAMAQKVYGAIV